jgi:hypothetical protein
VSTTLPRSTSTSTALNSQNESRVLRQGPSKSDTIPSSSTPQPPLSSETVRPLSQR